MKKLIYKLIFTLLALLYIANPSLTLAHEGHDHNEELEIIKSTLEKQKSLLDGAGNILDQIQNQKKWITLLIGTDNKKLAELEETVERNNKNLHFLEEIVGTVSDVSEQEKIRSTIEEVRKFNGKVEDEIRSKRSEVSILGWLFKLFEQY